LYRFGTALGGVPEQLYRFGTALGGVPEQLYRFGTALCGVPEQLYRFGTALGGVPEQLYRFGTALGGVPEQLYRFGTALGGVPEQKDGIAVSLQKPCVFRVGSSRLMVLLEPLPFQMKAMHPFEVSRNINPNTKLYNPEDPHLQLHRCGNLMHRTVWK
jgi:hypothetical protein